jgi:formyltetrahydrofolate synthetase
MICTQVYGADGVDYSPHARSQIEAYTRLGYDRLPICLAKTPLSLSHDPALKGVPKGFRVPIREVRAAVGAGYLYALAGEIQTMPGLPTRPAFFDIDLDIESGKITGLS